MRPLTTEEIDREIAARAEEATALAMKLTELGDHPGLRHVRRFPPAGVTADRWTVIEQSLAQLWDDLDRMMSILTCARASRAHRSKPTDSDRAELTRLLRDRHPAGLSDLPGRITAGCPAVAEFFGAVDEVDAMVARRLEPTRKRLDVAGRTGPHELVDLLAVSATDPLSLTTQDIEERVRGIERRSAELAELEALRSNWPEAIIITERQLDELRATTQRAAQTRERVERSVVTGALPQPEDAEPRLRSELAVLADPAALICLRQRIVASLGVVRARQALDQGLLDRRSELDGRLRGYQAKAARLGLADDAELLASGRIATGLLSRQPCDLRAVTRAIADFQQIIRAKQGKAT